MSGKTILIRLTNERVYFNRDFYLPWKQTNLQTNGMRFRDRDQVFWEVEMQLYTADNQELRVVVKDYEVEDITGFEQQQPKRALNRLQFQPLEWSKLNPLLQYYDKKLLRSLVTGMDLVFEDKPQWQVKEEERLEKIRSQERQPQARTWEGKLKVPFDDFRIGEGHANFDAFIEELNQEFRFVIANDYLLPEFDVIKHWFARKLRLDNIRVNVRIIWIDDELKSATGTSKQMDRINSDLIDGIKRQRVLEITRKPGFEPEKSLFTSEEAFDAFDAESGNAFSQSDLEILERLLQEKKVRNAKHLMYLASTIQSQNQRLKYTLHPYFGFLFMYPGETCNHFIWELLNSHATYIWSFDKGESSLIQQFKEVEASINSIKEIGRNEYKMFYKRGELDEQKSFYSIEHQHINSDFIDDFPRWRSRLEEVLI